MVVVVVVVDVVSRQWLKSGRRQIAYIPIPDETATDTWLEVRSILGLLVFGILVHKVFASTGL